MALNLHHLRLFAAVVDHGGFSKAARALNLSAKTVANYHTSIKQKLGVASDIELVRIALRENLVEP